MGKEKGLVFITLRRKWVCCDVLDEILGTTVSHPWEQMSCFLPRILGSCWLWAILHFLLALHFFSIVGLKWVHFYFFQLDLLLLTQARGTVPQYMLKKIYILFVNYYSSKELRTACLWFLDRWSPIQWDHAQPSSPIWVSYALPWGEPLPAPNLYWIQHRSAGLPVPAQNRIEL